MTKALTDNSAFTIRQPKLKPWHLIMLAVLIAVAISMADQSTNTAVKVFVTIIISVSITSLLYVIQNNDSDLRTATEFQSMAFSGAMRVNTMLSLIIHRDSSIFYLDPRYADNFTNGKSSHNLDQFLSTMGLESDNKTQIYDAIRDLKKAEFEYVYKSGLKSAPLQIGIYPLGRPEGYVCLTVIEK